jgi:hypothetical protein
MNNTSSIAAIVLDILKANIMQIFIWKWKNRMIAKYGLNWTV